MSGAIKIALLGMDERSVTRMQTVFKMVFKEQCRQVAIAEADMALVDVDGQDAGQYWSAYRREHPNLPAIVLSSEALTLEGVEVLVKPAKLMLLHEAIQRAVGRTPDHNSANLAGAQMEGVLKADESAPAQGLSKLDYANFFYKPDSSLQGCVTKAYAKSRETGETVFLKCWGDRWVVIYPKTGTVLENIRENKLYDLGLIKRGDSLIYAPSALGEEEMQAIAASETSKVRTGSIECFMWDLAVRTANGRVPDGTDLNAPVVLHRWPNLTRLSRIPNAMRMSAFWTQQPVSIRCVAEKLAIPLSNVMTFYSAATAIGLMNMARRSADRLVEPEVNAAHRERRSLFFSIMRKFGIAAKEEEPINHGVGSGR